MPCFTNKYPQPAPGWDVSLDDIPDDLWQMDSPADLAYPVQTDGTATHFGLGTGVGSASTSHVSPASPLNGPSSFIIDPGKGCSKQADDAAGSPSTAAAPSRGPSNPALLHTNQEPPVFLPRMPQGHPCLNASQLGAGQSALAESAVAAVWKDVCTSGPGMPWKDAAQVAAVPAAYAASAYAGAGDSKPMSLGRPKHAPGTVQPLEGLADADLALDGLFAAWATAERRGAPPVRRSTNQGCSSGDEDLAEGHTGGMPSEQEQRMRRKLSNRESARRSRERKAAAMVDLKAKNRKLAGEVQRLKKELAAVRRQLGSCQLAKASLEAAVASRHQQVAVFCRHKPAGNENWMDTTPAGSNTDPSWDEASSCHKHVLPRMKRARVP